MIKRVLLSTLTIYLIGFCSQNIFAADIKYKSSGLRDPFSDIADEKPVDDSAKIEAGLRALIVQGVIVADNNKSAIINNAIYRTGDKIGVAEIADIDRTGVSIMYNGKEIKLQLIKRIPSNEKKAGADLTASQK